MNLISCDGCGVVLDKNKIIFPLSGYDEDYGIDDSKAAYNCDTSAYHVYEPCPVCGYKILGDKV